MSQQRSIGSPETKQPVASRGTSPASPQSFQDGVIPVSQLQRMLGNRSVAKLIQARQLTPEGKIIGLQRKPAVSAAGDQHQQGADQLAREVLTTSGAVAANSMQRAMSPEEDKEQPVQAKLFTEPGKAPVQRQPETDADETESIRVKSAGALTDRFATGADVETQISLSKGRDNPLPAPLRADMEPRFGTGLSAVRGPALQRQHGSPWREVKFEPFSGDFADTIVGPSPASDQKFDMGPIHWGSMVKSASPLLLPQLWIDIPEAPPKAPWRTTEELFANPKYTQLMHNLHHKSPDEPANVRVRRREYLNEAERRHPFEEMRPKAWGAFRADAIKLRTVYDRARPMVNAFKNAETDKTLQEAEVRFQPFGKDESGDLGSLAEQQLVPRTNSVKLGDLFKGAGKVGMQPSTELGMTAEEQRGIKKASKSSTVDRMTGTVSVAEKKLKAEVEGWHKANHAVLKSTHRVDAALTGVKLIEAKTEQRAAESALTDAERRRAEAKEAVGALLTVVKSVALLGVGIPAARAGAPATTVKGMVGGNVEPIGTSMDLISLAAGAIVDSRFEAEIKQAQARLDKAVQAVHTLEADKAKSELAAAREELNESQRGLSQARELVAAAYIERRLAYETLGHVASRHSGVSAGARARICAYIAAVPVLDVVVSRAAELRVAMQEATEISYTELSGRGFAMALNADPADYLNYSAMGLVKGLGYMRGHYEQLQGLEPFYRERLASLKVVVGQLGGVPPPEPGQ